MEVGVITILWIAYAVLASVMGFFLSAIDVLSAEEGFWLAILAILVPYLEILVLTLMLLWYLHNLIGKHKANIRKSLRLNDDDNTNQEHEHA